MKKIFLIALVFTINGLIAQEREVEDFNKVTAFDQIDVQLIPSKENKVILNGENSEEVELVNKDGELKIRLPFSKMMKGDNISATVYYTQLNAVEANEGSRIVSESTIESTDFDISVKEGSVVNLKLDVAQLQLKINGGGKVNLSGKAKNQDVLLNNGSIYKASGLVTKQTIITANTGAVAYIKATDYVDAKVRAGGEITIYGKPKKIDKKTVVGGKIYEKDE